MPNKSEVKAIYLATRNEDGTFGEPILIKPMEEKGLYADDDAIDQENRKFYEGTEWKRMREQTLNN
ncbi:hypothetical protein [Bacillus toyonensis]|uniref:hypothetical protein n=1 Tax=Bacillus toyonensis TaxID=155322 RepID=UPI000BFBEC03|nr:hypothetical protein [Bacillus toyonensis]PHD85491.1 hypothetical protein COF55_25170 [Bacillus toyonensis]